MTFYFSYGITGSWSEFEQLICVWIKNRNSKKTELKLPYPELNIINFQVPISVTKLFQSLNPIEGISVQDFRDLLKNLRLLKRDFDVEHFARYEARVNEDLTEIHFPIRYVNGSIIGFRKVFYDDQNVLVETNYPERPRQSILPFPHGLYEAEGSSSCVVVGSILDSVVVSSRTSIPVVTLPEWTNLHPDHLPFLQQFGTVFIWLNNDVQGAENSRLFGQKIEERRCRLVSTQFPNPTAAVRKRLNVLEILEGARSSYHQFLTTFEALRDNVFLEFLQADELMGVKWKRFDHLNNILGGFRRGELTVFSGRTGSGKTTFLSEYSLDLCNQVR